VTCAARLAAPLLALVILLAGCGASPPSKFYVLTADPVPPRAAATATGNTVALGRITLPGALDRPQIARRRGANEIVFSEEERWAGPLDDMMRRVLADDLAARLPAAARADARARRVAVRRRRSRRRDINRPLGGAGADRCSARRPARIDDRRAGLGERRRVDRRHDEPRRCRLGRAHCRRVAVNCPSWRRASCPHAGKTPAVQEEGLWG